MDFNAWRDLAAASEEEVLQRQLADVESTTQAANSALSRAQREAQMARLKETEGAGVATSTPSSVGSYADYLKAKQAQANAQAQLAAGGVGEFGDVRRAVGGGYLAKGLEQTAGLQQREQRIGAEDSSGLAGANRLADERRARETATAEAAANRQKDFDAARGSHLSGLYERWLHRDQSAQSDTSRYAQQLSTAVDEGWKLPERSAAQRGYNPTDRRGWGIEQDAWGRTPRSSGAPRTRKGTAY